MLHLIFQRVVENLLERIAEEDALLFLENSVFNLLKAGKHSATLSALAKHQALYVLTSDLQTRGIAVDSLISEVNIIDYQGFVRLTSEYARVCSWT
jgi:tRNA 2-thiouridine synthesizing protein B